MRAIYKKSRYNIETKTESGIRLFNSRTGAIVDFELNNPQFPDFWKLWKEASFMLDEHEWLSTLQELGFVVPSELDEIQDYCSAFNVRQSSTEYMSLIVMPTEQCNFRCVYCYENFLKPKMSDETQAALKRYIERTLQSVKFLRIEWFGGEPFLAMDVIEHISRFAIESAERFGACYHATATTNGYLLIPKVFEQAFNEWKITAYQVTIDGPEAFHNQRRMLESGADTYERILSNIEYITTTEYQDLRFDIRMNVDKANLSSVPELIKIIKGIVKEDKRFFFFTRPVWGKSKFDLLSLKEEMELFRSTNNLCKEFGLQWFDPEFYLDPRIGMCYAADTHSLVIGSDGLIYKCTIDFDMPENQVGILNADGCLALDLKKLTLWTRCRADEYKSCRSCFLLPLCNGALCPKLEIAETKERGTGLQAIRCPTVKTRIKDMIKAVPSEGN